MPGMCQPVTMVTCVISHYPSTDVRPLTWRDFCTRRNFCQGGAPGLKVAQSTGPSSHCFRSEACVTMTTPPTRSLPEVSRSKVRVSCRRLSKGSHSTKLSGRGAADSQATKGWVTPRAVSGPGKMAAKRRADDSQIIRR
ncbi:hypothetical protein EGW08_019924 [Elysia chlorotica]|uniref:Uncharacterized protein n=1 Tax=Elysia chlorotica TaxID=188477 RepID=A0A3S1B116_ELYCH|nr:hypothetical protein EGW08_019924 [Elysia chlorotica]